MRIISLETYRCPASGTKLEVAEGTAIADGIILNGRLVSGDAEYPIVNGLPIFADTSILEGEAAFARRYYASIADTYDENVHVTFDLYGENELDLSSSTPTVISR